MPQEFDPGMLMEQIGGGGVVAIIVAVIVVIVLVKIVFAIVKKAVAVAITIALFVVLGGGIATIVTGDFGVVSGFFESVIDNMPWN